MSNALVLEESTRTAPAITIDAVALAPLRAACRALTCWDGE